MEKLIYTSIFILVFGHFASAQDGVRFGIKLGPSLSFSSPSVGGPTNDYEKDGVALKFLIGAFVDIPVKGDIYLQTGLNFAPKSSRYRIVGNFNGRFRDISSERNHQYLQVPLAFKFYTSGTTDNTRSFLNLGVMPEVRLNTNDDLRFPEFRSLDISGIFGFGLERSLKGKNRAFVSINYYVGFINQVKNSGDFFDPLNLTHNLASLEFGIKF